METGAGTWRSGREIAKRWICGSWGNLAFQIKQQEERVEKMTLIRRATPDDAQRICDIYNYYIVNTPVTFEVDPIDLAEMRKRLIETTASFPFFVSEDNGVVNGYSYANQWRVRAAFLYSAETSIYLSPESTGQGLGTRLYSELIADLRARKFYTALAGMSLPNGASVALHEKFGFKQIAHFTEIGWKFGKWIDTSNWQLML